MALQKQAINIDFSGGIDTKTDPFQLSLGKFLALDNMVYTRGKRLQKRNGYPALTALPDTTSNYLTTFRDGLTAIGQNIFAYSSSSETWNSKGKLQPIELNTLSLIRSNTNQAQADTAVSDTGLLCTVFTDVGPSGTTYKYVIADSTTGQNVVAPTLIPSGSGTISGSPRVFLLGRYFIIVFTNVISAVPHLQYVTINTALPTSVLGPTNISSNYSPSSTVAFDAFVANNIIYFAWNGADAGNAIRIRALTSTLTFFPVKIFAGYKATIMSVCADVTGNTPQIYVSFYDLGSLAGYTLSVDQNLNTIFSPVAFAVGIGLKNVTSSAQNLQVSVFYEEAATYSYDSGIETNFIARVNISSAGSVVGSAVTIERSVGLASKSFIVNGTIYLLSIYSSAFQPTYFLLNSSGQILSKLAYSNAPGYYVLGLPSVSVSGDVAQVPYLFRDLLIPVNKTQGVANAAGVYSQTGINLATFNLSTSRPTTAEIGNDLHISGGFLWMYDGYVAVEHGFHLWPDYIEVTTSGTGGLLTAQQYFYQVTYEWTDNQGNIHRSAPSIPVSITTSGSTSSNTIHIPTLRLTYKTANPVKIVIYRWSAAQQTFYQVTSTTSPLLNDVTVDSVSFVDTLADSSILGNSILYTTGGVVENIGAPATAVMTLFKSRLFLVDSEDRNLLWYSKQVIEATPVEMSDLFTLYIAPTTSAQGATGPITALSAMDDKLIIFKQDAIYYITGNGPDNTGANNDFSEPIFITSTVGCANPQSIVFSPKGLMFQSDKGIWLLGRDLSTSYIGADVEAFNADIVSSAVNVPVTNQVRFTLSSGITLMYDYYYGQWGTFSGVPAISSTLFESMHTYIDAQGQVFQEQAGTYLDGSNPVLMSFTTGWLNLAGLQGYERAYFFTLLGNFITPHKLTLQIEYDYAPGVSQQTVISPFNYNYPYGGSTPYGAETPYGGTGTLEQWKVHLQRQQCQAFQISMQEMFDPSYGTIAGAGLTLSGLDCVVGLKKGWRPLGQQRSAG